MQIPDKLPTKPILDDQQVAKALGKLMQTAAGSVAGKLEHPTAATQSPNLVDAGTRALDFLCRRYRDSVQLVVVDSLPVSAYGFDPKGWDLFTVVRRESSTLGATHFVAVSRSTDEVRDLGRLG